MQNNGGYIAEFYVSYSINRVSYTLYSGAFSLGFSGQLNVPSNADSIYLKVNIWIFGGSRVLFDNYLPNVNNYCFSLTGTIFDAEIKQVSCNSLSIKPPTSHDNMHVILKNNSNYNAQMHLTYYILGKIYSISSPIIPCKKCFKLNIPNDSHKIELKIYAKCGYYCQPIFDGHLILGTAYCFTLTGTIQAPICTRQSYT